MPTVATNASPDRPDLLYRPRFLPANQADALLAELQQNIPWQQHIVKIFGKKVAAPRLSSWHGDPGMRYTYSGLSLEPQTWTTALLAAKHSVESTSGTSFNSALLNYYRDGNDSMGWHSDNEAELGLAPYIASLSLGSSRRFLLRHKKRKDLDVVEFELGHGDLLIMRGTTQDHWKHQIPKTRRAIDARINITFRFIAIN